MDLELNTINLWTSRIELPRKSIYFATLRISFQLRISQKYQGNTQKPNRILTEGLLLGSLKTLSFRTFSEMSCSYVGFTDSDSVTVWVRNTALQ